MSSGGNLWRLMLISLTVCAFVVRLYNIHLPHFVVFDEVHFGKFASYYIRGTYFFDVHPPLAKMLLALVAWLAGDDGSFTYDTLGIDYYDHPNVPYVYIRCASAIMSSLLVPVIFLTSSAAGHSVSAATLAAGLVLFDNSLVTNGRFILLDSFLLLAISIAVLSSIQFWAVRDSPFSKSWWFWLAVTGVSLGCSLSIKFVGIFVILLVGGATVHDLWRLLVPLVIYIGLFAVHLMFLPLSGPGDSFMTLSFQEGLRGNSNFNRSFTQPTAISYGSRITLHHNYDGNVIPCWLHSHPHRYPLRYEDERVSSQQQQTTCYGYKPDPNNWWIVKHPDMELDDTNLMEIPQQVLYGDRIQLIHAETGRSLNSHDVASPLTPTHQEVSCYGEGDERLPKQDVWIVDAVDSNESVGWTALDTHVTFTHVGTNAKLAQMKMKLPKWGFEQFEVVTVKKTTPINTNIRWFVEEHINDKLPSVFIDASVRQHSFWQKFLEAHRAMLKANNDLSEYHPYGSRPLDWPLLRRGISFWQDISKGQQIYLIGNPLFWWSALIAGGCAFLICSMFLNLRNRRNFQDLHPDVWTSFEWVGWFLTFGWALHFVPFFFMNRQLFLHHYFPCLIFKSLLAGHMFHFFTRPLNIVISLSLCMALLSATVCFFIFLAPFTYGFSLTHEDSLARKILSSWNIGIPPLA